MIDNVAVITSEGARVVAALEADRHARIPWSDDWTVATCARHVGSVHHVVAQVVRERPTADFGLFSSLAVPEPDDAGLAQWVSDGTAALVDVLRSTDPSADCWSWWPDGRSAAFWQRRMAQETLVHRWDAELGAGARGVPMEPVVAADGIDEFLDVFVAVTRGMKGAPAGPSFHVHCTDTDGEWVLELPTAGERVLSRVHSKADVALRGPAEALLLTLWGRVDAEDAGVEVLGDHAALARRAELLPPM
jgi:uncharacterized protein (TIGR03083 family)